MSPREQQPQRMTRGKPPDRMPAMAQVVVGTVAMDLDGVLQDRQRQGQRVHVYASLIYGNSGVAYLAVDADGTTLLVSSNAISLIWPSPAAG